MATLPTGVRGKGRAVARGGAGPGPSPHDSEGAGIEPGPVGKTTDRGPRRTGGPQPLRGRPEWPQASPPASGGSPQDLRAAASLPRQLLPARQPAQIHLDAPGAQVDDDPLG